MASTFGFNKTYAMHIANFIIVGVFVINIVLMDVKIILAKSIEVRVIEVRDLAPLPHGPLGSVGLSNAKSINVSLAAGNLPGPSIPALASSESFTPCASLAVLCPAFLIVPALIDPVQLWSTRLPGWAAPHLSARVGPIPAGTTRLPPCPSALIFCIVPLGIVRLTLSVGWQ